MPRLKVLTTSKEIYDDLDGQIDIFVSGVGTGGTISGVGKYLKERIPNVKIVAVEPKTSPVLSKGESGKHRIQGIGAGFVPNTLDTSIYDEVITIDDEDAFEMGRMSAKKEGPLVGISSGAAIKAGLILASRKENEGKTIVVFLPDTGGRYLSTAMFDK
ncbi:MAG: pyridoxal-phosphate dependent enzyme [Bacilli bacterium]|nr:pyridoxal-phosphate dependent enzyme [Bacilli bacterium]